jgi:hypothetical protein
LRLQLRLPHLLELIQTLGFPVDFRLWWIVSKPVVSIRVRRVLSKLEALGRVATYFSVFRQIYLESLCVILKSQ